VFDASHLMALAAIRGLGVALLPVAMFQREVVGEQLVQPFAATASAGSYWLTHLASRPPAAGLERFRGWLTAECAASLP
jgi:LysR family transcriptional regulator of beta-lactamase